MAGVREGERFAAVGRVTGECSHVPAAILVLEQGGRQELLERGALWPHRAGIGCLASILQWLLSPSGSLANTTPTAGRRKPCYAVYQL
jgi:hypothetical protein